MTAEMLKQTEEAHRSGKLVGICPRGAVVGGPSLTMGPHLARTLIRSPGRFVSSSVLTALPCSASFFIKMRQFPCACPVV